MFKSKPTRWKTKGGIFVTHQKTKLKFSIPELDTHTYVTCECHVDDSGDNSPYDMIIGRDLLRKLKLKLDFGDGIIEGGRNGPYEGRTTPMKGPDDVPVDTRPTEETKEAYEGDVVKEATKRMTRIQDAVYEKADLRKVVTDNKNLNKKQQKDLLALLKKYEFLFDGTLGTWEMSPVNVETKPGATPHHARTSPVPHVHEAVFRKEVERLCKLGVLCKVNQSEWGAPTFIQPKKNGTVRFLSDF